MNRQSRTEAPPFRPRTAPSVLFVLPWHPDGIGGVNTCVTNLYRKLLAQTGYRPVLLQNEYPFHTVSPAESRKLGKIYQVYIPTPLDAKAPIKSVVSYLVNLPLFVLRFRRFVVRENVQVVNLHFPGTSAATILFVRDLLRPRCRVVLSFHGADVPPIFRARGIQRLIWQYIFRRSDAIVGCSRYLANLLLIAYPMLAGKTYAIHNGVDIALCAAAAHATRLPAELNGLAYIVMVARFEEKKAHEVMLDTFSRVLKHFPEVYLVLLGTTGPTLPVTRKLAEAPELSERVMIYTDVPHETTLAVIAKARLLVLPSRLEPFGIVIIEAGALDTPVIASNVGGVPEIIDDGQTGLLVPAGDAAALASAICDLVRDTATARDYAAKLKAVVAADFTWERALLAYREVFRPTCL
jgi:glycosyltransferase involved in cell wall biosynthesis